MSLYTRDEREAVNGQVKTDTVMLEGWKICPEYISNLQKRQSGMCLFVLISLCPFLSFSLCGIIHCSISRLINLNPRVSSMDLYLSAVHMHLLELKVNVRLQAGTEGDLW